MKRYDCLLASCPAKKLTEEQEGVAMVERLERAVARLHHLSSLAPYGAVTPIAPAEQGMLWAARAVWERQGKLGGEGYADFERAVLEQLNCQEVGDLISGPEKHEDVVRCQWSDRSNQFGKEVYVASRDVLREAYTVGIIRALDVEKAAVEATLDEEHGSVQKLAGDNNSYSFGRIGQHDMVVACLPAGVMGKASAATVAKDMMRSFPIKAGFMVGVDGGVWSELADVRLGDVVVRQPDRMHGGVL
ncbi:hypothetical protein LTR49_025149 [Elasticomyces elasticus]|nr:hypothetical protein LTR49_025149 [Elasticomyces elasticus]